MSLTIITGSIPQRADLLPECLDSVARQTVRPDAHLIYVDYEQNGPGPVYAHLFEMVETDWVMMLGDDDLLDPHHVEILTAAVEADPTIDVAYTYCRTTGTEFTQYNQPFDADKLARYNVVSSTAMFRRELAERVGGIPPVHGEDWELWKSLAWGGARFVAIPEVTWTYRLHIPGHQNYSWTGASA